MKGQPIKYICHTCYITKGDITKKAENYFPFSKLGTKAFYCEEHTKEMEKPFLEGELRNLINKL